jgi:hypothetical protein
VLKLTIHHHVPSNDHKSI